MASENLTWTDILIRQHEMTPPQDSRALTHLLGALDSMCDDREHEITSERILNAVQRAFEFAAPERNMGTTFAQATTGVAYLNARASLEAGDAAAVPQDVADALDRAQDRAAQAEAHWYADDALTPWQRREISDAAARTSEAERALDDYYRLTED